MRFSAGALALLLTACWLLPAQSSSHGATAARKKTAPQPVEHPPDPPPAPAREFVAPVTEKLIFDVEWRLIHAGSVVIESRKTWTGMKLESAGLVSSLFKVNDTYSVNYDEPFCATSSLMDSQEGKRHRETKVTYDRTANRAAFLERDVLKDIVVRSGDIAIPNCVHDVVTALIQLRTRTVDLGQSVQLPVSDGRHTAAVRLEAQEREEVKAPAGDYKAVRYEAYLMNGVIYARKGRVFIWLSDDGRHLPVQIRLRMPFPIGNVTLQLHKEERF